MKNGKPQNGYDRLKIKLEKLQREYDIEVREHQALEKRYEELLRINNENNEICNEGVAFHENLEKQMLHHMGWFRRLTWMLKTNKL